jgi:hypothetical protein
MKTFTIKVAFALIFLCQAPMPGQTTTKAASKEDATLAGIRWFYAELADRNHSNLHQRVQRERILAELALYDAQVVALDNILSEYRQFTISLSGRATGNLGPRLTQEAASFELKTFLLNIHQRFNSSLNESQRLTLRKVLSQEAK